MYMSKRIGINSESITLMYSCVDCISSMLFSPAESTSVVSDKKTNLCTLEEFFFMYLIHYENLNQSTVFDASIWFVIIFTSANLRIVLAFPAFVFPTSKLAILLKVSCCNWTLALKYLLFVQIIFTIILISFDHPGAFFLIIWQCLNISYC